MFFFEIVKEFFRLLVHMLPPMFIGLYFANVLGKSGQLERVGAIMAPLSDGAKLPKGCSSVLTLCLLINPAIEVTNGVMSDLIRHPVTFWIPAFTGMTIISKFYYRSNNREAGFLMLSELNRKNGLSDKEVIIVSMLASLPLCIRSIIFFVAPVSFSMLGLHVGIIFTLVYIFLQLRY